MDPQINGRFFSLFSRKIPHSDPVRIHTAARNMAIARQHSHVFYYNYYNITGPFLPYRCLAFRIDTLDNSRTGTFAIRLIFPLAAPDPSAGADKTPGPANDRTCSRPFGSSRHS